MTGHDVLALALALALGAFAFAMGRRAGATLPCTAPAGAPDAGVQSGMVR